jgi:hypothetical protein
MSEHHVLMGLLILIGIGIVAASYLFTYLSGWANGWDEAADTSVNYPNTCLWKETLERIKGGM